MPLLLRTHYNLAITSLKQNRVRSLLTCLGISIGIASIILILSLMGSIHNLVANQVKSIGADLIVVRPTSHRDTVPNIVNELTSASQYHKSNLTLQDVKTIKKLPHLAATAPVAISRCAPARFPFPVSCGGWRFPFPESVFSSPQRKFRYSARSP